MNETIIHTTPEYLKTISRNLYFRGFTDAYRANGQPPPNLQNLAAEDPREHITPEEIQLRLHFESIYSAMVDVLIKQNEREGNAN